jgi:hypothetical protein
LAFIRKVASDSQNHLQCLGISIPLSQGVAGTPAGAMTNNRGRKSSRGDGMIGTIGVPRALAGVQFVILNKFKLGMSKGLSARLMKIVNFGEGYQ